MIDFLVCNPAIVLQDVVVLHILRYGNLLRNRQNLGELIIGDIMKFGAVVFRNDEL